MHGHSWLLGNLVMSPSETHQIPTSVSLYSARHDTDAALFFFAMATIPTFGSEQAIMDQICVIPTPPQDPPTLKDLSWASFLVDTTRDAHGKLSNVY